MYIFSSRTQDENSTPGVNLNQSYWYVCRKEGKNVGKRVGQGKVLGI